MFTKLVDAFRLKILPALGIAAHRPRAIAELVRLGVGAAKIQRVTSKCVEYTNEAGVDCNIDLTRSAKHDGRIPIVGFRGMLDVPPWVRFFNERSTRFEFADSEEAYEALLFPLSKCGWETMDAN